MTVLSIQSSVVAGHVGNSAAMFAYFAQGITSWCMPTGILAHHPGRMTTGSNGKAAGLVGRVLPASELGILASGLSSLGAWAELDAIASGWLGQASTADAVAAMVDEAKRARPGLLYMCDPVIGDWPKGQYVPAELASLIASGLVPRADILVPNHFELEHLSGIQVETLPAALQAADRLRAMGPSTLVVTSLRRQDGGQGVAGTVAETLAVTAAGAWLCSTPMLNDTPSGSGDLFAAMFLARLLRGRSVKKALHFAVAATYGVLLHTVERGRLSGGRVPAPEMLLTDARQQLTRPAFMPGIERVR